MSNKNKKRFHKGRIGDHFRIVEISNDNLKRKNRKEYKKIAILVMFLLISVIGTSYGLFKVLLDNTSEHEVVAGTFKVEFEEGNEIHLTNLAPMSDSEGMSTEGYHFTIKNTGTIDAKYHVSLEETPASSNTLDRKYINYSIKLSDGSWTSPRSLSDGLLLNSGSLSAESGKDEVDYELKMWLREDADNSVQGKTYSARIVVSAVQSNSTVDALVAPVINIPNTSIHISLNDSFTDPVPYEIKDSLGQTIDISNVTKIYEYYDGVNTISVDGVDTSKSGIYYIYYRVSDKDGNVGCTVVSVSVNPSSDDHIPTITLVGEANVELKKGEDYQELGASAEDVEDGVLTDKIIYVGTVNSLIEDIYTIKYIVIDSKGNTNSIARVVHVISKGGIEITTEEITRKDNKYHIPVHIVTKEGDIGGYYLSNHNKRPTTSNYTKLEKATNQYDKEFIVPSSGSYYLWVYDTNHNVTSKKIEVEKIGGISSSDDEINLKVGQSRKLNISNYTGTLSYESSNPDIAMVDNNGVIQGTSVGTTTITVTDTATSSMIHITVNVYKEVTATFSSNGSKLDSTTKSCEIWGDDTGCEISSPSIEREGYKILGFSQNADDTSGSWDANTRKIISEDVTYYAITSKDIHIMVYYNNDGNVDSITENKTIYNQNKGTYQAPDEVVNSTGLRGLSYQGIAVNPNSTETEEIYTNIISNQVYYAIYGGNIATKFYYYNNGQKTIFFTNLVYSVITDEEDKMYHISQEEISVPEEVLLSEGEDHRSYYGVSNRPSDYRHIESSITTENETYYAVYKGKWEISYANDEETVKSIGSTSAQCDNYQITDGDSYTVEGHNCTKTLPEIISKDHYSDGKWYDQNTVVGNPGDEYTIHGNKELLAKAKEKKYVVKYNCTSTGGSCNIQDKTLQYGELVDLDEVAEKSGYDFLGWHTNKDSSSGFTSPPVVTGNMTLYAIFRKSKAISLNAKISEYTGKAIEANEAELSGVEDSAQISYQYYSDTDCNNELSSVPIDAGNYSVRAILEGDEESDALQSSCVAHTITPKRVTITWNDLSEFSYNGERQAPEYNYRIEEEIENEMLEFSQSKEVNVGSYVSVVALVSVTGGQGRIENYVLDNNRKNYDIIRADGYINLSSNGRVIEQGQNSDSFIIVDSHGGELNVEETTKSNVGLTLEDNNVTISNLSDLAIGTVITIQVTCLATDNYTAATKEYTITIKKPEGSSDDAVARIEKVYYTSLEKALEAAKESGDTIVMLKNTTESVENVKNVTIDLNGKTITGMNNTTIINNGTLTVINSGTIKNDTDTAIVNNSTLILGENDDTVSKDNPYIVGTKKGIYQQGTMNFYDGLITAELGLTGYVNDQPEGYEIFTDHDYSNGYQKVYLEATSSVLTRAVARTINYSSETGNEIISINYYFNLQDAIDIITDMNTNSERNRTIYAIRDFEAAYKLNLDQNEEVIIDISGYTVETGYDITNEGNLTLTDSSAVKGVLKSSIAIKNNNQLNLDGITLTQTTNRNVIDSTGYLNISNSNINATSGYGLNIKAGGLAVDNASYIRSTSSNALYIRGADKIVINGGYYQSQNSYAIDMVSNANIEINNINITTGRNGIIARGTVVINSANIDVSGTGIDNRANLVIEDGTYKANTCITNTRILSVIGGNYEAVNQVIDSRGSTVNIGDPNDKTKIPSIISENKAISIGSGTINIYNVDIESNIGVEAGGATNLSTVNIYDGTIGGRLKGVSIRPAKYYSYLNLYGGKVLSDNIGICLENSGFAVSKNVITIGNKEDDVNTITPEIIGKNYGLYKAGNGGISFYDGILKGKTAGHAGAITTFPEGYGLETGEELIEGENYKTTYLGEMTKFLKVGEVEYNTFEKALKAIDTEGTIEVIESVSIAEEVSIPSGKDITLDLRGKQLTNSKSIINEGKLKVVDNSPDATGIYTNTSSVTSEYAIKSTNDLTLESGTINSAGNASVIYISGKGSITGGTYSRSSNNQYDGLYIATDMDITGGTYDVGIRIVASKTVNMTGVECSRNITTGQDTNLTIENSTINNIRTETYAQSNITIKSGNCSTINNKGNTVIGDFEDVTKIPVIRSEGAAAITVGGTLTIYNGDISGYDGINASGTINIYKGTITGLRGTGIIMNTGTLNVHEGKIVGKTYGIQTNANNANVVIGNKEDDVNTTTPEVIGEQYGLYISNGIVSFYDGILKGKTAGHAGAITTFPEGYGLETGEELIEGENYKTTYLGEMTKFLKVGEVEYNTFEKALKAIDTEGTIEVIESVSIAEEVSIPSGKDITLDLRGKQLTNSKSIINEGKLKVVDNSPDATGIYTNTSSVTSEYAIKSTNDLTLESGTINSAGNASVIYISGKGSITGGTYSRSSNNQYDGLYIATDMDITGGTYDVGIRIVASKTVNMTGVECSRNITTGQDTNLTIENSTINNIRTETYAQSNITIKSGNCSTINNKGNTVIGDFEDVTKIPVIRSEGAAAITVGGTLTIYNGDISGYDGINASGTINIYKGTITGLRGTGIIMNTGTLNVHEGKIVGKTYGIQTNANNANVVIGNKEDDVNTTTPEVIGEQYGLYISNGIVSFYDGILKGKTAGYYGDISVIPSDYIIDEGEETIDEVIYQTNYLAETEYFIQNGETQYSSLKTAVSEAQNGDTLTVTKNYKVFDSVDTAGKNITLDLNGHHLKIQKTITNNGTLSIIDNGDNGKMSINKNMVIINNKGNLVLGDIVLENFTTNYYLINNNDGSSMESNNTSFTGYAGIYNRLGATLVADHISLDVMVSGIYNYSNCKISNSTLTRNNQILDANAYLFYNDSKENHTVMLENNTYNSDFNNNRVHHIINQNGTLTIKDGYVNTMIENRAILNLLNVNMKADYTNSVLNHMGSELNIEGGSISGNNSVYNANKIVIQSGNATIKNVTIAFDSMNHGMTAINITNNANLIAMENVDINMESSASETGVSMLHGNATIKNTNIHLSGNDQTRGIYLNNSNTSVILESGEINVDGKNVYGILVDNGSIQLGIKDGSGTSSATVSIENPLIRAIGTTMGVGVKKVNGLVKYYDGKIIGSTNAKPETTTETETKYEVRFYVDEETGYEYCILEFME